MKLPSRTVPEILFHRKEKNPEGKAFLVKKDNKWNVITWDEFYRKVEKISAFLATKISAGERVTILGDTAFEWCLCDMGTLFAGGISIGIYPTLSPHQIKDIINDCGASIIFVENDEQLKKIKEVEAKLKSLKGIYSWSKIVDNILSLNEIEKEGEKIISKEPEIVKRRLNGIKEEDIAIIIYTSGTTGQPKGAMITHRNVMAELHSLEKLQDKWGDIDENDIMLFFLPLSHVGERIGGFYYRMYNGVPAAFTHIKRVLEDIREIKPTIFGSVPRIFEKAYSSIHTEARRSFLKRKIFEWAKQTGLEHLRLKNEHKKIPFSLKLKYALAHFLVFRKIKNAFGGRVRFFISSAAPISPEILTFFQSAGMEIFEGYGATEVSCFITMSHPESVKPGYVGPPMDGVEIKIADDGEILVKAEMVFKGYWNNEIATAEVFDTEGWYHTGDLGEMDEKGNLKITGRKKEIIITSGGKNIAPAPIENALKKQPLISNVFVYGDKKPYITALITLDERELKQLAQTLGITETDYTALIHHPQIVNEVEKLVQNVNKNFSRVEQIKKFKILPRDFSVEEGEITPTLKVRRHIVEKKFKDVIESMYK